jgi:hypothetical protein
MNSSILKAFISFVVLPVALGGMSALAGTIDVSWTGAAVSSFNHSGYWGTAANWSDGAVPNNGDGTTYNVTLPSFGSVQYQVGVNVSTTVDSVTVDPAANLFMDPNTPSSTLNVTGNVYVTGAGSGCSGLPYYCGTFVGGPIHVSGTIYNNDGEVVASPGTFATSAYVQSGAYSYGQIDGDTTANLASGSINGGRFVMFGSKLNGNLAINGGTFEANCLAYGTCSIDGNLAVSDAGTVATQPSTGGRFLSISGDASLAGTLDLNFSGLPGLPSYDVMTYSAENGKFSTVDATGLNGSEKLKLEYGPTALVAVISTPEASSIVLVGIGLLALTFALRRSAARPQTR